MSATNGSLENIKEPHNTGKDLEGGLFWEHSGTVLAAWPLAELENVTLYNPSFQVHEWG